MANQWLRARQTKYAAYAAVYILVVIAAVVVVNVLANRYNKSFDATSNKRYSLSAADREDRERPEAERDHHLLQPEHALQRRERSARRIREPFAEGPRRVRRSG